MPDDTSTNDAPGVLPVLQTRQQIKAYYDKIAGVYDLLAEHSEQPMRAIGLEMLAAKPGETILEVGFGTGHCLVALAKAVGPDGAVIGVDLSSNMVEHAARLIKKEQLDDRVTLYCHDAALLPFEPDTIDGIFTSFALELFDTKELHTVLTKWQRVLRPGGRLVVVSVSKEGERDLGLAAFEWTHRHFPNLLNCRPIFVGRALEAAGFTVADKRVEHMWVPVEIVLGVKPS